MLLDAGFPPPPFASPPTPPNMISQAPSLPRVAAKASPAPTSTPMSNPFATSMNAAPSPSSPYKQSSGAVRRFFSWLIVLAVIGGLAAAAFIYGPELMERATGDESIDGPPAPMAFPTPVAPLDPIRTATYVVERNGPLGAATTYTVTTDYETGVSQTTIDRGNSPDLEALAIFDEASIRRVDEPVWYSLPRGDFPLETSFGRTRWVRTLDELLPQPIRDVATVTQATESVVGTVPTRHLVITIDPKYFAAPAAAAAPADPSAAGEPAASLPPGLQIAPGTDPLTPVTLHLWIDDAGLVRKLQLPEELGGETITVTSVSSEAFVPLFPTADQVQPLTASALLGLGL